MSQLSIPEKMLSLLSDGMPHSREELHTLCGPSSPNVVRFHIHQAKKLLPLGEDIVCMLQGGKSHWQVVVQALTSPYTGT